MHDNCSITCSQDEALDLLGGMQKMFSSSGGGAGGKSKEDVMDETADAIQKKQPAKFDLELVEHRFPTLYEESMNTVVKQECMKYNNLLSIMERTLTAFRKAVKGLIVMTAELEGMGNDMYINKVPEIWAKKGPLSMKPLSNWIIDVNDRVGFFSNWVQLSATPPVFWISGFFFPQAFFTGALQNCARKYKIAIDTLSFSMEILSSIIDPAKELVRGPDDGAYIYGIFLEGCRWERSKKNLEESIPKELYTQLPPFLFIPKSDRVKDSKDYDCPCYRVVSRRGTLMTTGHSTNYVMMLELPTDQKVSKWIKAGVAAFLALKV